MCGIIGYVGQREASPILLEGLRRLEYRGYDSAGIGTLQAHDGILLVKDVGKVEEIAKKVRLSRLNGTVGIAHTRWATHGGVTKENAHPHTSCSSEVAIVHNGIIENYFDLRRQLEAKGHQFTSETDSEVIAHLLEDAYSEKHDILGSMLHVVRLIRGSYAFVAVLKDTMGVIAGAREDAPLVAGVGVEENFLASDALAFVGNTDRAIFLDNKEIVIATDRSVSVYDFDGKPVQKPVTQIAWEVGMLSRGDYDHYTLKEIHAQKETVHQALSQDPNRLEPFLEAIKGANKVFMTACGSSFHAALLGKLLFNTYAGIPVEVMLSSEFEQYERMVDGKSLLIAVSQSGETADVLAAVKAAKNRGATVSSIVNTAGSTLVRQSSYTLLNNCGPEIGVAATKSFTSQLMVLNVLALRLADMGAMLGELDSASSLVEKMLSVEGKVKEIAERYRGASDFYFVGRAAHYPLALEGALKLKELSYVHAEGIAAGELKHGSIALVSDGTPVVTINPEDSSHSDTLSNASEVKARGGKIIGISTKESPIYDEFIQIPSAPNILYPVLEAIPLQLLAYYAAIIRQHNPDYPRNLAKSVTVK